MASHRVDRTSEDIKFQLIDIMRGLKDPRVNGGLLSIVKLDLSSDLSHCKVYVSSLEGPDATKAAVEGLKNAGGLIRREIAARVRMRRTPEFHFIADDSIAHSAKINKMLEDLT